MQLQSRGQHRGPQFDTCRSQFHLFLEEVLMWPEQQFRAHSRRNGTD